MRFSTQWQSNGSLFFLQRKALRVTVPSTTYGLFQPIRIWDKNFHVQLLCSSFLSLGEIWELCPTRKKNPGAHVESFTNTPELTRILTTTASKTLDVMLNAHCLCILWHFSREAFFCCCFSARFLKLAPFFPAALSFSNYLIPL